MITYASFVAAFPEFASASQTQVDFWIPIAYQQLNACRFGASLDLAAMLFVAHNVAMSEQDGAAAALGAPPGEMNGPITNKAVGSVSVGSDPGLVAVADAGAWNGTRYGTRLYTMMRMFNLGPAYRSNRRRIPLGGFYPIR